MDLAALQLTIDGTPALASIAQVGQALRGLPATTSIAVGATNSAIASTVVPLGAVRLESVRATSALNGFSGGLVTIKNLIVGGIFYKLISEIVETSILSQGLHAKFMAITDDAATAQGEFDRLKGESNRLGISFKDLTTNYIRFTAATKDTTLQGEKARTIFRQLSESMSTIGVPIAMQNRAWIALEEIQSRGILTMDKLRRQLGNDLPGAFHIAATAMGMTSEQFTRAVHEGKILSDDFLPKFAAAYNKAFNFDPAANSAQRSINRLKTALFDLFSDAGESGIISTFTDIVNTVTSGIKIMHANFWQFKLAVFEIWTAIEVVASTTIYVLRSSWIDLTQSLTKAFAYFREGMFIGMGFIQHQWQDFIYGLTAAEIGLMKVGELMAFGFGATDKGNALMQARAELEAANKLPDAWSVVLQKIKNESAPIFAALDRNYDEDKKKAFKDYFDSLVRYASERLGAIGALMTGMYSAAKKLPLIPDIPEAAKADTPRDLRDTKMLDLYKELQIERAKFYNMVPPDKGDESDKAKAQVKAYNDMAKHIESIQHELDLRTQRQSLSFAEAWQFGALEAMRAWGTFEQRVAQGGRAIMDATVNSIGDGLTSIIDGTKTASKAFIDMGKIIEKALLDVLIKELLVKQLTSSLTSAFGGSSGTGSAFAGLFGHQGGVIGGDMMQYVPRRFHGGGVVGDETQIIARRSEVLFTPEQMAALGGALKGNQSQKAPTIINAVGDAQILQLMAAHPEAILNVIAGNRAMVKRMLT